MQTFLNHLTKGLRKADSLDKPRCLCVRLHFSVVQLKIKLSNKELCWPKSQGTMCTYVLEFASKLFQSYHINMKTKMSIRFSKLIWQQTSCERITPMPPQGVVPNSSTCPQGIPGLDSAYLHPHCLLPWGNWAAESLMTIHPSCFGLGPGRIKLHMKLIKWWLSNMPYVVQLPLVMEK